MEAVYVDEEEVWKCPKHPSKRRKSGICHVCLRERLVILCPDCANVRPCGCCATTSSSSSFSSSFRFPAGDGVRVSKLLEGEPSFRRSRSVAAPFLRSTSKFFGGAFRHADFDSVGDRSKSQTVGRTKTPSFWSSVFRSSRRSKTSEVNNGENETTAEKKVESEIQEKEEDAEAAMRRTMMRKSRSVAVPTMSSKTGGVGGERPPAKGRGRYFPSPIKAFRHSKISKIFSERSPVYRG
ncbi:hypothetical protein D8674_017752 [Pyrus ussuriensis x Pyrus communis]|uniref:Uncharacterized protein n=1 Tax=Pyrus ussuriensis x Pyrus communis TaxID=2448454 RepID=A0A5N5HIY9_9ROSA|nr:hypothetical protein D8674_017752 [Pyrus ussuriensis x Pyrus communis]